MEVKSKLEDSFWTGLLDSKNIPLFHCSLILMPGNRITLLL